jgi:anti-anti-sigma factor
MLKCDTGRVADLVASVTATASAEGSLRLIELAGEADMTSRHLKDLLEAEVAARPPLIVVDLSRLTFMDSWALHTILAAARKLRGAGGMLALAAPSGEVRRILELSGADTLVDVYASVQEASAPKFR